MKCGAYLKQAENDYYAIFGDENGCIFTILQVYCQTKPQEYTVNKKNLNSFFAKAMYTGVVSNRCNVWPLVL